ncbi:MAG: hypothetical protein IJ905_07645 [Fibrobacter sp.]|nr:hypothetical protein [Fibrobacter sp.]
MKVLLDTNIIIHREASHVVNQDIGILFKWLDRTHCEKLVHSKSIEEILKNKNTATVETFKIKVQNYEVLQNPSPMAEEVLAVSKKMDSTENDSVDTILLNEVFCNRVDLLITEDKKIHTKAAALDISDKVFNIDRFLEKIFSENPELVNYKVLNVQKVPFGKIDLNDPFFRSLKDDYEGFDKWFLRKYDESAYITINSNNGKLLSFLYVKKEDETENYSDITPPLPPKKRLKVGTFKVISNGFRLGERFLKIIFDNALKNKVEEIYVTIFDRTDEQKRLIALMEKWGFVYWGKEGDECVYVRDFNPNFAIDNVCKTYPYISKNRDAFIVPIYPDYHTELLPDSILNTESPSEFVEDSPHRNSISKVYVSRAFEPHPKKGDLLIFYRTGGVYKSVITTIGIVTEIKENFSNKEEFVAYCRKGSVFPEKELEKMWDYRPQRPFVVSFLYVYSFPNRINMSKLIDMGIFNGVNDAPRGFRLISKSQFERILKETASEGSFIVD